MKTKFNGFLTLLLAFVVQISFAQQKTISGSVTEESGALPGVSVLVKGTASGQETDFDGKYSIKAKPGDILVFRYLGYKTVERTVGSANVINVKLEQESNVLDEIVVVGYGSGQKVGNVVGSIATISSESIKDRPSPNVIDGLQGRIPGLQVFTSSGEPSASSSFRIQGNGSLSAGSEPLIVLDGIPTSNGSLVSLNPSDFETISVLKDASATSIYGTRAANGVIYITTKKGKRNTDAVVTLRTQYGVSNLANTIFFDGLMNADQLGAFQVAQGLRTQAAQDALRVQFPNDTKWVDVYYRSNAPIAIYDLSISGGGQKTTYFISANHTVQDGLAARSRFERTTFRANIDTEVKNWMRIGLNLSAGYDNRQTNPFGSNNTNRGLSFLAQPWFSPVDENGERYTRIPGWNRFHPDYLAESFPSNLDNLQLNPNGYIQLTPIKNLTIRSQAGIDFFDVTTSDLRLPSYEGSLRNGSNTQGFQRQSNKTFTNTIEYKFDLNDDNNFTFLAGHELVDNSFRSFSAASQGQTDDRLVELDAGTGQQVVNQSLSESVFESLFGRVNYSYKRKYFFDASIRQDGSSRFGARNKKTTFGAVGVLWKAKEESFLKDVSWLTDISLRASYGTSGNADINNYSSLALVGNNQYSGGSGFFVSTPGNDALSWEEQKKGSVGLNMEVFERLRVGVEYYHRTTNNLLVNVPIPPSTGESSLTQNVGELVNKGIDFELNFDVLKKSANGYIRPYVNFNYNHEEITELFQDRDFYIIPNTGVAWVVGQPRKYFYPLWAGVNPQTGSPQWYQRSTEANPETLTNKDPNRITTVFNTTNLQQNTGINRNAPINGGFGIATGTSGFDLNADFSFSIGKYLISNDRFFAENPVQFPGFNQSAVVLDYWKQPGDVTRFPRLGTQFTQFDDRLIEDASFIRLKSLSLGYTVSKTALTKTGLKGVRFFTIGRNLLTFTKFTGPDPEIDSNLALGNNPNTKQISFGVEVQF